MCEAHKTPAAAAATTVVTNINNKRARERESANQWDDKQSAHTPQTKERKNEKLHNQIK